MIKGSRYAAVLLALVLALSSCGDKDDGVETTPRNAAADAREILASISYVPRSTSIVTDADTLGAAFFALYSEQKPFPQDVEGAVAATRKVRLSKGARITAFAVRADQNFSFTVTGPSGRVRYDSVRGEIRDEDGKVVRPPRDEPYVVKTRHALLKASLEVGDMIQNDLYDDRPPKDAASALREFRRSLQLTKREDTFTLSDLTVDGDFYSFVITAPGVTDGDTSVLYDSRLIAPELGGSSFNERE